MSKILWTPRLRSFGVGSSRRAFRFREIIPTRVRTGCTEIKNKFNSRPRIHLKTIRFCSAYRNGAKNCPACNQSLTILPSPLPSLPLPFCQHRSALCPLVPHLKQVPLKPPSPLPLTASSSSPSHSCSCHVRVHLRHIHWDRSFGLCGSGSVRAHTWRDSTNLLRWMAHPSHVYISSLPRLLQHVVPNL